MSIATQEKIADFVQNAKQMVTEAVDKVCSKRISLNCLIFIFMIIPDSNLLLIIFFSFNRSKCLLQCGLEILYAK